MDQLYFNNKSLGLIDGEIWVDVVNYDGIYSVSNLGRVKSEKRIVNNGSSYGRIIKERILSQAKCKDGRLKVNLSKNNIYCPCDVSVLVFEGFNGKNESNKVIMRINKNFLDNRLINLRLATESYSHHVNYLKGLLPHLKKNRLDHKINKYKRNLVVEKNGGKICNKCFKFKPINFFHENRNTCKECRAEYKKKLYKNKCLTKKLKLCM